MRRASPGANVPDWRSVARLHDHLGWRFSAEPTWLVTATGTTVVGQTFGYRVNVDGFVPPDPEVRVKR